MGLVHAGCLFQQLILYTFFFVFCPITFSYSYLWWFLLMLFGSPCWVNFMPRHAASLVCQGRLVEKNLGFSRGHPGEIRNILPLLSGKFILSVKHGKTRIKHPQNHQFDGWYTVSPNARFITCPHSSVITIFPMGHSLCGGLHWEYVCYIVLYCFICLELL